LRKRGDACDIKAYTPLDLSTLLKDYVSLRAGEALSIFLPPFEKED